MEASPSPGLVAAAGVTVDKDKMIADLRHKLAASLKVQNAMEMLHSQAMETQASEIEKRELRAVAAETAARELRQQVTQLVELLEARDAKEDEQEQMEEGSRIRSYDGQGLLSALRESSASSSSASSLSEAQSHQPKEKKKRRRSGAAGSTEFTSRLAEPLSPMLTYSKRKARRPEGDKTDGEEGATTEEAAATTGADNATAVVVEPAPCASVCTACQEARQELARLDQAWRSHCARVQEEAASQLRMSKDQLEGARSAARASHQLSLTMKEEHDRIKSLFSEVERRAKESTQQVGELSQQLSEARTTLARMRAQKEAAGDEKQSLVAQVQALQAELAGMQSAVQSTLSQRVNEAVKEAEEAVREEARQHVAAAHDAATKALHLQEQLADAKQRLEASEAKRVELERHLVRMQRLADSNRAGGASGAAAAEASAAMTAAAAGSTRRPSNSSRSLQHHAFSSAETADLIRLASSSSDEDEGEDGHQQQQEEEDVKDAEDRAGSEEGRDDDDDDAPAAAGTPSHLSQRPHDSVSTRMKNRMLSRLGTVVAGGPGQKTVVTLPRGPGSPVLWSPWDENRVYSSKDGVAPARNKHNGSRIHFSDTGVHTFRAKVMPASSSTAVPAPAASSQETFARSLRSRSATAGASKLETTVGAAGVAGGTGSQVGAFSGQQSHLNYQSLRQSSMRLEAFDHKLAEHAAAANHGNESSSPRAQRVSINALMRDEDANDGDDGVIAANEEALLQTAAAAMKASRSSSAPPARQRQRRRLNGTVRVSRAHLARMGLAVVLLREAQVEIDRLSGVISLLRWKINVANGKAARANQGGAAPSSSSSSAPLRTVELAKEATAAPQQPQPLPVNQQAKPSSAAASSSSSSNRSSLLSLSTSPSRLTATLQHQPQLHPHPLYQPQVLDGASAASSALQQAQEAANEAQATAQSQQRELQVLRTAVTHLAGLEEKLPALQQENTSLKQALNETVGAVTTLQLQASTAVRAARVEVDALQSKLNEAVKEKVALEMRLQAMQTQTGGNSDSAAPDHLLQKHLAALSQTASALFDKKAGGSSSSTADARGRATPATAASAAKTAAPTPTPTQLHATTASRVGGPSTSSYGLQHSTRNKSVGKAAPKSSSASSSSSAAGAAATVVAAPTTPASTQQQPSRPQGPVLAAANAFVSQAMTAAPPSFPLVLPTPSSSSAAAAAAASVRAAPPVPGPAGVVAAAVLSPETQERQAYRSSALLSVASSLESIRLLTGSGRLHQQQQ